ncbi:MAG: hypothetical protein WCX81_03915 [Monoglobales bacterium]
MNNTSKITQEEIRKVASMSNADIERKLKSILDGSKNSAMKKMLSGIDIESFKRKLQSSSKEEIESFMGIIGRLDPAIINKIKDSLS